MRTGRLSEFRHGQRYFRTDPRIILNQFDIYSSAQTQFGWMQDQSVLRSKAEPPLNSPTRFNNHGVASLPLLSMPCSLLSLTACSTASCTLSPVVDGGGGTARSVARGLGRFRPVSTYRQPRYEPDLRINLAAAAGSSTLHGAL